MAESLVEKYAPRSGRTERTQPEPESGESDLGCFGWLRGAKERAVSLELRKKDGRILAIAYGWIDHLEYDPDNGITIHAGPRTIRIEGSGLDCGGQSESHLFRGVAHHRVPWVQESGPHPDLAPHSYKTFIKKIMWE